MQIIGSSAQHQTWEACKDCRQFQWFFDIQQATINRKWRSKEEDRDDKLNIHVKQGAVEATGKCKQGE